MMPACPSPVPPAIIAHMTAPKLPRPAPSSASISASALTVGQQVRAARGDRSQAELAAVAGIPQPHWANVEGGKNVTLATLLAVARTLGVPLVIHPDAPDPAPQTEHPRPRASEKKARPKKKKAAP